MYGTQIIIQYNPLDSQATTKHIGMLKYCNTATITKRDRHILFGGYKHEKVRQPQNKVEIL